MKKLSKSLKQKLEITIIFLIMLLINTFANVFRFNGTTTGEVSQIYESLFVPMSFTFFIWLFIYVLLLAFVIYILFSGKIMELEEKADFYYRLTIYFIVSCMINIAWIISWQYDLIIMSLICTILLFAALCMILILFQKIMLSKKEIIFIQIPFSFYLGWSVFSLIANITVIINKFSLDFGKSEEFLTIIFIGVLTVFIIFLMIIGRNPIYGISNMWGFVGILIRHISMDGYAYLYPDIVKALIICIGILIIVTAYYLFSGKAFTRKRKSIFDTVNSVVEEATSETVINHTFKEYETAEEIHKQRELEEKKKALELKKEKRKERRDKIKAFIFKKEVKEDNIKTE